jgi:hypothetical protein
MLSIIIAEFERERIGPGLQIGDVDLTRNAEFEGVARSKWAELGGVDVVESLKTAVVGRKSEAMMIRWLRKEPMTVKVGGRQPLILFHERHDGGRTAQVLALMVRVCCPYSTRMTTLN